MSARVTFARLRARLRHGDAGMTLTELVVVMALSTIIGALMLGLFLQINTSTGATVDRTIDTSSARNAIEAWTGYLRVADGYSLDGQPVGTRSNRLEWVTPNDMMFYADLQNRPFATPSAYTDPTMIWLRLDTAGALVEEQFPRTAVIGTKPTVCRTVASGNVAAPTGLFTPYDANEAVMPMDNAQLGAAPTVAAGCQALPVTVPSQTKKPDPIAQTNLPKVTSVTIDFVVSDTKKAHPLEFKSQAVLPVLGGV